MNNINYSALLNLVSAETNYLKETYGEATVSKVASKLVSENKINIICFFRNNNLSESSVYLSAKFYRCEIVVESVFSKVLEDENIYFCRDELKKHLVLEVHSFFERLIKEVEGNLEYLHNVYMTENELPYEGTMDVVGGINDDRILKKVLEYCWNKHSFRETVIRVMFLMKEAEKTEREIEKEERVMKKIISPYIDMFDFEKDGISEEEGAAAFEKSFIGFIFAKKYSLLKHCLDFNLFEKLGCID